MKVIKVSKCCSCPHIRHNIMEKWYCGYKEPDGACEWVEIEKIGIIQEWCPLEDYNE